MTKIALVLSIVGLMFSANSCEAQEALIRSPGGFMLVDLEPLKFTIDHVEYHSVAECEKNSPKAACEAAAKKALKNKAKKPDIKSSMP